MRLLVEFSHPAQVHKFKHVFNGLIHKGHKILILARKKDVMTHLLDVYRLPYKCISRAGDDLKEMMAELIIREFRTLKETLKFKPDLMLSAHSVAITHIGWLLRIPVILHDDTEHASLQQKLYLPFADYIVTSTVYQKDFGPKHFRLNSLEPLAYLHPDHFKADPEIIKKYGLTENISYGVLRFVSWNAAHDTHLNVKSSSEKIVHLIERLCSMGIRKIVLSTENNGLKIKHPAVFSVQPEDLHHVLAFSNICISEGGSIANEAAVLGIPTILINPLKAGIFDSLESYGLLIRAEDINEACEKASLFLRDPSTKIRVEESRKRLLRDKENMAKAMEIFLLSRLNQRKTALKQ